MCPKPHAGSQAMPAEFPIPDKPGIGASSGGFPERFSAAKRLLAAGQAGQAQRMLMSLVQDRPGDFEVMETLGRSLMAQSEFESAADIFAQTSEMHPHEPKVLNSLGIALSMAGRHEQAKAAIHRAVDMAPRNPLYWANLGKILMLQQQWQEAQACLEKAFLFSSKPEQMNALMELIEHCRQEGASPDRM